MPKQAFDKFMENKLLHFLESKCRIYFDVSQSRWGFISVLSTISLSFIATGISLFAFAVAVVATLLSGVGIIMTILGAIFAFGLALIGIIFGIIGLIIGISIVIIGIYFLRNQTQPVSDLLARGIVKGTVGNVPEKDISKVTEQLGMQIGIKIKKLIEDKNKE